MRFAGRWSVVLVVSRWSRSLVVRPPSGMPCARSSLVIVKTLEELQIYQQSISSADAISAVVVRPAFRNDCRLRDQLRESSGKVPEQIAEGFSRKRTDTLRTTCTSREGRSTRRGRISQWLAAGSTSLPMNLLAWRRDTRAWGSKSHALFSISNERIGNSEDEEGA